MALPREYTSEFCPIARALEVVGERWTLLIVRDAFYGVSRFSDFHDHLGIPRAVLADRLSLLVSHGILARGAAAGGREEYRLTAKGLRLWSTIWSLISWGNEYYVTGEARRVFTHAGCPAGAWPAAGQVPAESRVSAEGRCEACGAVPGPGDLVVHPRTAGPPVKPDPVSQALGRPHRLLAPLPGRASRP